MPEIVDNKKVGEYIKTLLKKHEMTQNDLANELHITRSAVSQNLSGKSTFDLQNLVKISELFEISLDKLLNIKSKRQEDVISEYERLVKNGLEELKTVPKENLILHQIDLYGKVFVEYVIEYKEIELFEYLLNNKIPLYELTSSNSKDVLLKIIIYMVDNEMDGFLGFVSLYVESFGSLTIGNVELEKQLFIGLEKYKNKDIIFKLVVEEISVKESYAKFINRNKKVPANIALEWIKTISTYHLDSLLDIVLKNKDVSNAFDTVIYAMILSGYKKGVVNLFDSLSDEQIVRITSNKKVCSNVILYLKDLSSIPILSQAIQKGI